MKADYYMGDLYPNLAYFSTRAETIPEAADQTTLVDQQETSQKNPINISPETNRSIWWSVGFVFVLIILLGIRF
jgi:hypothetical protein